MSFLTQISYLLRLVGNLTYFWISPTALFFWLFSPWRYDHLSGCSGACLDTFVLTPRITLGLHCYISAMIEMWKSLVPSLGVNWIFSSTCVHPFWDLWVLPRVVCMSPPLQVSTSLYAFNCKNLLRAHVNLSSSL